MGRNGRWGILGKPIDDVGRSSPQVDALVKETKPPGQADADCELSAPLAVPLGRLINKCEIVKVEV